MACPFFHPTERVQEDTWAQGPRRPLGDLYTGHCTVAGVPPDSLESRQYCNNGYARSGCTRFPSLSDAADAIRFSITGSADGSVALICIFEKDYGPVRHVEAVYDIGAARFTSALESTSLEAQALKFVESYLHRRAKS